MKKPKRSIRVNFRLPKSLIVSLSKDAESKGITSSELLRIWVKSRPVINLQSFQTSKTHKYFNFYLNPETARTLEGSAHSYGISKSMYLRLVLQYYLGKTEINGLPLNSDILVLHRTGNFQQLINLLENNTESLDPLSLILLSNALVNTANYGKAREIVYLMKSCKRVSTQADLIMAKIAVAKREVSMATAITDKIMNLNTLSTGIKANTLMQIGVIEAISGNRRLAINLTEKSAHMFNKLNCHVGAAHAYIYMTYISLSDNNLLAATKYLDQATQSLVYLNSPTISSLVNATKARIFYQTGKFTQAASLLVSVSKKHNKSGNLKALTESYGYLALTNIQQHNYDNAIKNIIRAQEYEDKFRKRKADGLAEAIKLYLLSKDNYKYSMFEFNELLKTRIIKIHNKLYLYHCAQLFHGQNSNEKQKGVEGLKKLVTSNAFTQIKHAAAITLKTNQIQPMSV